MSAGNVPSDGQANARRDTLAALAGIGDEGWRASGVSLYVVVAPGFALEPEQGGGRFWAQPRDLSDRLLYRIAEPASRRNGQVVQPDYPLHDVPQLFADMFQDARTRQPVLRAGGAQYVIAHIQELHAPPTPADEQQWKDEPWKREKVARVVTVYLRGILDTFDQARIGTPRGYFDHYDYITRQTGHIAFGRTAAVLGGLSDTQLRTFVTQLSIGEMAREGGLTRETFVPTLTLVGQWNGNQDVRASVDLAQESVTLTQHAAEQVQQNVALTQKTVEQVRNLDTSGRYALTGTIWISYALAVIGVVTALLGYMKDPLLVSPGSLFLGASCVIHAWYASSGNKGVRRVALVLFWTGCALAAAGVIVNLAHMPLPAFIPGATS
jgi:hypothetical protein